MVEGLFLQESLCKAVNTTAYATENGLPCDSIVSNKTFE